jgi:hypothetical protein
MKTVIKDLIEKATINSELNPERLVSLVAMYCIQVVLTYDDIIIAEDLANTFGIDG